MEHETMSDNSYKCKEDCEKWHVTVISLMVCRPAISRSEVMIDPVLQRTGSEHKDI